MTTSRLKPPVSERDHRLGSPDAPITLVAYGDYECPFCGRATVVIQRLQKELGDQLRFVFRNFPLAQIHPHAELAAEAAEAAGAQGKFWEMHDLLFENQAALEEEHLVAFAASIGLDMDRFLSDLNERQYAPRITEDVRNGLRSGVNGTPTFYINGLRHEGMWDFDTLLNTIQLELFGNVPPKVA